MTTQPRQMNSYLEAMAELSDAKAWKAVDDFGFRAALRKAWNLYDGLSREEQRQILKPDGKPA